MRNFTFFSVLVLFSTGRLTGQTDPDCVAPMDLNTWQQEGVSSYGNWNVSADGKSLTQSINGEPTFFVTPDEYINTTVEGEFGVQTSSDDDFIGFVLGYQSPNSSTATNAYDFILFDWKQRNQTFSCFAPSGMTLRRISGVSSNITGTFWCSSDPISTVLATNASLGGWQDFQYYKFKANYTETNIKIWIDDVLVFDVDGQFQKGKFGFYNYSQAQTVYRNFVIPFKTFFEKTDSSCPNLAEGTAEAIPSTTDLGPYTYNWSNGATTKVATDLVPGTYTVDITSANGCHTSGSVTIESPPDVTPPQAVTRDITVELDEFGNAVISPEDIDNGSSDNCGIENMSLSETNFTTADLGAKTVTLTVTDYESNSDSETATVTVVIIDLTSFITTWKTDNPGTSCNSCITIPTTGTGYNYDVDWDDDGIFDQTGMTGSITHDFGTPGTYTIRIRGDFPRIFFNNEGDKEKILSVDQWGQISWRNMNSAFMGCLYLHVNAEDAPDLSKVSSMSRMFFRAKNFNENINGWNVSQVTDMSRMFQNATSFDQPIGNWDVSKVINMNSMFVNAYSFNQDIGIWDVSNVTDMGNMFNNAISFNQDIGNWDVRKVTSMANMFNNAESFNNNINDWNVSNVSDMSGMFSNTDNYNQPLDNWDVSNVQNMSHMFNKAINFNSSLNDWNTSSTTNMFAVFTNAAKFNQPLNNWNVSNVTNMASMFHFASSFNQDLGSWNVINVISMNNMFLGATLSTENYDNLLIGWSTQSLKPNVNFHGGNSQYCEGTAARQKLIDDFNWTITDAGPAADLLVFNQDPLPDITETNEVSLTPPTAINCAGETVTATTETFFPITEPGETIVIWTYQAPDGTTLQQLQKVFIENELTPEVAELPDLIGDCEVNTLTPPTAINSSQEVITATTDAVFPLTSTTTVTWTYQDGTTTLTQDQEVIIDGQCSFITTWKTNSSPYTSITIPTTGGGYNYHVDWNNDGVFDELHLSGSVTHNFGTPGTYTIRIKGEFPRIYFNNRGSNGNILSIDQWGGISWTSMESAFLGCHNLILKATDIPDLSRVTDMSYMFSHAESFNQNINNWDVSNVTNMEGLFMQTGSGLHTTSSFNQPLGNWDVSNVTNMKRMFWGAGVFNQSLVNWNVGNVTNMSGMFSGARSFNQPLANWKVGSVFDMSFMFRGARSFNQPIGNWDVSNVTNMAGMLGAETFNRNIENWNVSKVENMQGMFGNAKAFNQPIGAWDVSMVTNMAEMFIGAISFNQNIETWDVGNVVYMYHMFNDASSFNQPLENWDVNKVINMRFMFYKARAFNQEIEAWNVSNVTDMTIMFGSAYSFNQPIGNWDVSNVTRMSSMFQDASSFDQPIGNWEVANVTHMENMFLNTSLSTENYDNLLIGWSKQNLQSDLNFHGGNSTYCEGTAARQQIIDDFNWTITDAGPAGDLLILDQQELPDILESCEVTTIEPPTATDCAGATVTGNTTTTFPITGQGENTITWTFEAANGTTLQQQQQKVVIKDLIKPELTPVANKVVAMNTDCSFTIPDYTDETTATDNCGNTIVTQLPPQGTIVSGQNTVKEITLIADDGHGNIGETKFTITLEDWTLPDMTAVADKDEALDANCAFAIPDYTGLTTATDNCGTVTVTQSPPEGTVISEHNTVQKITLTANDGNEIASSLITFEITLKDVTPPELTAVANRNEALDGSCEFKILDYTGFTTATDNCGSTTVSQSPPKGTIVSGHNYVQEITLTADDGHGNTAETKFSITLKDGIAPELTAVADQDEPLDLNCGFEIPDYTSLTSAIDNCGSTTVSQFPSKGTIVSGHDYVQEITLTADDGHGNTAETKFSITLKDGIAPELTTVADKNEALDGSCEFEIPDYTGLTTARDNCGTVTVTQFPPEGTVVTGHDTVREITLTADDSHGNTAETKFSITLKDETVPELTTVAHREEALDGNCEFEIPDYTGLTNATDNCGTATVTQSPPMGEKVTGHGTVHEITLTADDGNGNSEVTKFNITVKDITPPTVVTKNIVVNLDSSGNASIAEDAVNDGSSDACGGLVFDTNFTNFTCTDLGDNPVELSVTDANGLSASAAATVTVQDLLTPVAKAKNMTIDLDNTGQAIITAADLNNGSTDNCKVLLSISQSSFDCSHIGTNSVVLTVKDPSGNEDTATATVTVNPFQPETEVTVAPTAAQYSDEVTFTTKIKHGACSSTRTAANKVSFYVGTQKMGTAVLSISGNDLVASLKVPLLEDPSYPSNNSLEPGLKEVKAVFEEVNSTYYQLGSPTTSLTITTEDVILEYVGQELQATEGSGQSTATVMLSVNIQDISASSTADPNPGDIRNARVKFIDRDSQVDISGWISVQDLLDPADTKTAVVSFPWQVDIGNSDAESFTIGILVDGYYSRGLSTDYTVITVYKPQGDFITGGGYIAPTNSSGTYASTDGLKTNFGFNVKYNKKGKNLNGHMNVIFRRLETDGVVHSYQIKGNAMQSLGVNVSDADNMTAEFITKANLTDITDPHFPISLGGNLYLQVNMTDRGEPGTSDEIAISLKESNGRLLFSTSWTGISTEEMYLGGGNLVVHSGFSNSTTSAETAKTSTKTTLPIFDFIVSPNPSTEHFTVDILSDNEKDRIYLYVYDYNYRLVHRVSGKIKDQYVFGETFQAGTYIVIVEQGSNKTQKLIIKDN